MEEDLQEAIFNVLQDSYVFLQLSDELIKALTQDGSNIGTIVSAARNYENARVSLLRSRKVLSAGMSDHERTDA